ncbi:hypothetical protein [Grimontia hollisae]|uniref:hypothetical protein n=1 Tax=Grimontia hollisae TaxID=673 RepID=UPI00165DF4A5|nr:hypothetical protein [Grimontia hollisae]
MGKFFTTAALALCFTLPSTLYASSSELVSDDAASWQRLESNFKFYAESEDSKFWALFQQVDDSDVFSFVTTEKSISCELMPEFTGNNIIHINNQRIKFTTSCLESASKIYEPTTLKGNEALKRTFLANDKVEVIILDEEDQVLEALLFTTKGFSKAHDVVIQAAVEPI